MRIEVTFFTLAKRLRGRREEIEQAALARIYAFAGPTETSDPEYVEGLRVAVCAAIGWCIDGLEHGEDRTPALPTSVLSQARFAARNRIGLDTVLRRCIAGHALLCDFTIEEAEGRGPPSGGSLKRLLRMQAASLDRLLDAVSEEYAREAKDRPDSAQRRRMALVERLLRGEPIDRSALGYSFDAHHLGIIGSGAGVEDILRQLASELGHDLMLLRRTEDSVWAWLGAQRQPSCQELQKALPESWRGRGVLAVGEPGVGVGGWRLTHQQAQAAMPIALRGNSTVIRYADVALLASALRDDLLVASLRKLYLAPLERGRDGGAPAIETLRAYFAAERQVTSAAVVLGVNRNTVTKRLAAVEEALGRPLGSCASELESALRIADLAQGRPG